MRRAVDVVWRSVDHALVIGRPGRDAVIVLGPAAATWSLLSADMEPGEIAAILAKRHGTPIAEVRRDLRPLLDRFVAEGFVVG